jgi:hypothetical protein
MKVELYNGFGEQYQTYGKPSIVSQVKRKLVRREGFIEIPFKMSLKGLDNHEEEY